MIGMDEGSSSARMSRYETGTHEPAFGTAEKLAAALRVPAAYFYCEDDRLAEFLVRYGSMAPEARESLLALIDGLQPSSQDTGYRE